MRKLSLTDVESVTAPLTPASISIATGESAAITNARAVHGELHDLVENLSEKVSSLVASQDHEFLSVYRVHMHGVHRELEMARMEALAAEEMLKDDKTVAALQAEHTWFQEECARLDALIAGMHKDLRYLKSRQAAVEAQNRELSRQLKTWRREIKRMQLQRTALLQSQQDHKAPAQFATDSFTARELLEPELRPGNRSAARTASSTRQHKKTELSVDAIEAELFEFEATRSEEQEILEDCVREVAEFVLERKNQAIQPVRKGDRLRLVKGVSGLGLSHFTESDRIDALRAFLLRLRMLDKVVGYLSKQHLPDAPDL